METLELHAPVEHEDLAPLVAEMINKASRGYANFWSGLHLEPSSEEDEVLGCEAVRQKGVIFTTSLAHVSRLIRDQVVDLGGRPFPPPRGVVQALHDLQTSYTFLIGIQSYEELLNQPLVPWEQIQEELNEPTCREWMKAALAAY